MGYQISVADDVLVLAVHYALGRATYIVSDTCSAVRQAWADASAEARTAISDDVAMSLRSARSRGLTLGMEMDEQQWRDLSEWMAEHDGDETGTATITCDESMLLSAVRIAIWEGLSQPVIERVKACWGQMSPAYRGLIRRDVASDLRRLGGIETGSALDGWDDLLAWIDMQSDIVDTRVG